MVVCLVGLCQPTVTECHGDDARLQGAYKSPHHLQIFGFGSGAQQDCPVM